MQDFHIYCAAAQSTQFCGATPVVDTDAVCDGDSGM
jgi:hypothetical protein